MKTAKGCLVLVLILSMAACTTDQILADLNLALQIAAEIIPAVTSLSPTDGAAMQKVSTIATEGLAVIETSYKAYEASGATTDLARLEAALDAFKGNLNAAIVAAHVVNPASQAKILDWANLIYSVTDAILSAIPQAKAAGGSPKAMRKMSAKVALPKPEDVKAQWARIKGQ